MSYRENMLVLAFEEFEKIKGRDTDPRWGTALKICSNGDINGAARLVTQLLGDLHVKPLDASTPLKDYPVIIDHMLYDLVIGTLANLGSLKPTLSIDITEMLCKAVDAGYVASAYNAANGLLENAKSPDDFRRAERYFKIAIATLTDKSMKAASLVNYCSIVRDGLITGERDHQGAIAIYEQAAELGLVTGMFNAANVSMWEISLGKAEMFEKAAYWFQQVVDTLDSKRPLMPMDSPQLMPPSLNEALKNLADFHINGKIEAFNLEYGIKLANRYKPNDGADVAMKNWLIEMGLTRRLMMISRPPVKAPVHHWHYLLQSLGWAVEPVQDSPYAGNLEMFDIKLSQGKALFVVLKFVFQPEHKTPGLDAILTKLFIGGYDHIFLVSAIGMFKTNKEASHLPVVVYSHTAKWVTSFNIRLSPEQLIENAKKRIPFLHESVGMQNCVLPIALNTLNSGRSISDGIDLGCAYSRMEGWCIPGLADHVLVDYLPPA